MMTKRLVTFLLLSMLSTTAFSFGFNDLVDAIDGSDKCKSGDRKCKNREYLKTAVIIGATAIAVKLIADMVVEHRSKQLSQETEVIDKYKKKHKVLPPSAAVEMYDSTALPGNVVKPGEMVKIQSNIEVVPGRNSDKTIIEEQLNIYDNEDNTKILKSLTKAVNKAPLKAGRFQNQFSFVLPEGMPQGVYPIKTVLWLNNKEAKESDTKLQLVLNVNSLGQGQLVALAQ